jgi:hypothetical protein
MLLVSPEGSYALQVPLGPTMPLAPCPTVNNTHSLQAQNITVAEMVVHSVVHKYHFHNDNEIEVRLFSQVSVAI